MSNPVKFSYRHKRLARLSPKKLDFLNAKAERLLQRAAKSGTQKQLDTAMGLHQDIEYARLYKIRHG